MKDIKKIELDEYEKWIENEIEKGHFIPVKNFDEWKKALEEAARVTLNRIEEEDKAKKAKFIELLLKQRELRFQEI